MNAFISQSFDCHAQAQEYFDKWARKQPTIMTHSQKGGLWVVDHETYRNLKDQFDFGWWIWMISE